MGSRKGTSLKKNVNGAVISPKPDSNTKRIKLTERTGVPHVKTETNSGSVSAKAETFSMFLSTQQLKTQEALKRQKISIKEPNVESEQTLHHCAKLKLQLFPMDERTRIRLEKDKHNPHLELTLSARKRIISVLKHLNSKWGNSRAASGELMLFPYNIDVNNLAGCMTWMCKHLETCIGDVYGVIGRPAIFRLRYGWSSNPRERFFEEPLASFSVTDPLQLEDSDKEYKNVKDTEEGRQASEKPLLVPASDLSDSKEGRKENREDNQRSDAATMSLKAWADCLTNVSMGSLFSDASRFGLMAVKGDSHLRQASFSTDSFDAAIAAHLARHQSPMLSNQTSILDGEETCQGFLFQKTKSAREVIPSSSKCSSENVSSHSVKPELQLTQHLASPGEPAGNSQTNQACQDDNINELGITDLSWSCSLGPCDLGQLSSSRQIISADSISFGSLFATSVDAVQNSVM